MDMKKSGGRRERLIKLFAIVIVICMVLMSLGYVFMMLGYGGTYVYAAQDSESKLDELDGVLKYIVKNYKDKVEYSDLVNAAYDGVFSSLGDPYSAYYVNDKTLGGVTTELSSEYSGIGVTLQEEKDGRILILNVAEEGPAYDAGIKAGSYVTAVDGVSTKGMSVAAVASAIRGEPGTAVNISVSFGGGTSQYRLVRRQLALRSVHYKMLEDDIGGIKIDRFAENVEKEFAIARMKLLAEGADSFIIDLRDNSGGYMNVAVDIAEMLLDEGTILTYTQQGKQIQILKASADSTKKVPIAVMVNGRTASAAEMLTAALKDNGAAVVVGETTFGKGIVQWSQQTKFGDSFKLSCEYFLRPNGESIDGRGIVPDYIVYSSGYLTEDERIYAEEVILPLDRGKRYFAGQYGLNVLAAQQRLVLLGYDVDTNARMDDFTLEALSELQKLAGGKPYGGLDYFTLKALDSRYNALLEADGSDAQLKKAIELLK